MTELCGINLQEQFPAAACPEAARQLCCGLPLVGFAVRQLHSEPNPSPDDETVLLCTRVIRIAAAFHREFSPRTFLAPLASTIP